MRLLYIFSILCSSVLINPGSGNSSSGDLRNCLTSIYQDSSSARQVLYNGRIWRNLYAGKVQGNQFLFSDRFLTGSVSTAGRLFEDIRLRYDIFNDEIMIITDDNKILQLNKELIEGFSVNFNDACHNFINVGEDSTSTLNGYAEVLYNGKSVIYVKHKKEISRLKEGRILDIFLLLGQVYVKKDGSINNIKRTKDFKNLLADHRQQVKSYMKSNRIRLKTKSPESFIPVLKFYDGL